MENSEFTMRRFQKIVFHGYNFLWEIFSLRLSRGGSVPLSSFLRGNFQREIFLEGSFAKDNFLVASFIEAIFQGAIFLFPHSQSQVFCWYEISLLKQISSVCFSPWPVFILEDFLFFSKPVSNIKNLARLQAELA